MKDDIKIVDAQAAGGAGVLCWWELNGSTNIHDLCANLGDAGLEALCPGPATRRAILGDACRRVARAAGNLAAIRHRGSWFLIELEDEIAARETEADADDAAINAEDLTAHAIIRARCVGENVSVKRLRKGTAVNAKKIKRKILEAVEDGADLLDSSQISSWLSKIHGRDFDGLRLRPRGGLYFIPPSRRELWSKFWGAVRESSGHFVSGIDAARSEETVRAVLNGLRAEVDEVSASLDTLIADDEAGVRAAKAGVRKADALIERISAYSEIIGLNAGPLIDQLDELAISVALVHLRG